MEKLKNLGWKERVILPCSIRIFSFRGPEAEAASREASEGGVCTPFVVASMKRGPWFSVE
jgi:hypothetical protein